MALDHCPHCTEKCHRARRYFECVVCQQRYHRNCCDVWYRNDDPRTFTCHRCALEGAHQIIMQLEDTHQPPPPSAAVALATSQVADASEAAASRAVAAAPTGGEEAATAADEATVAAAVTSVAPARLRALVARPPSHTRDE